MKTAIKFTIVSVLALISALTGLLDINHLVLFVPVYYEVLTRLEGSVSKLVANVKNSVEVLKIKSQGTKYLRVSINKVHNLTFSKSDKNVFYLGKDKSFKGRNFVIGAWKYSVSYRKYKTMSEKDQRVLNEGVRTYIKG